MSEILKKGTELYKGISGVQYSQLESGGIANYETTFAGAELGPGFYLSTNAEMAKVYAEGKAVATNKDAYVVTYTLQEDATGEAIKSGWETNKNVGTTHAKSDFVMLESDYNFHTANGQSKLTLTGKQTVAYSD